MSHDGDTGGCSQCFETKPPSWFLRKAQSGKKAVTHLCGLGFSWAWEGDSCGISGLRQKVVLSELPYWLSQSFPSCCLAHACNQLLLTGKGGEETAQLLSCEMVVSKLMAASHHGLAFVLRLCFPFLQSPQYLWVVLYFGAHLEGEESGALPGCQGHSLDWSLHPHPARCIGSFVTDRPSLSAWWPPALPSLWPPLRMQSMPTELN